MKVLFVCVHNAGRSQMAESLLKAKAREAGLAIDTESAGTLGGGSINPVAAQAIEEIGLSLRDHHPKALTQAMADGADLIISMGCGVDAEACPAKFLVTEDWGLDDPAGQPLETVRKIRDQIAERVDDLIERLKPQFSAP